MEIWYFAVRLEKTLCYDHEGLESRSLSHRVRFIECFTTTFLHTHSCLNLVVCPIGSLILIYYFFAIFQRLGQEFLFFEIYVMKTQENIIHAPVSKHIECQTQ